MLRRLCCQVYGFLGGELNCSTVGVLQPFTALNCSVVLGGAQYCSGASGYLHLVHPGLIFISVSSRKALRVAGVWKNRTKFLILTLSLPVFSVVWKWRISFHDQMWFYFSLHCERHSVLQTLFSPSSWPGGSIRKLMEIQVVQISRVRGVLRMSGCSSVVYWQVPLSWLVLIWFIPVLELPCKPWVVCLQCLCQFSKPVDLNFL